MMMLEKDNNLKIHIIQIDKNHYQDKIVKYKVVWVILVKVKIMIKFKNRLTSCKILYKLVKL